MLAVIFFTDKTSLKNQHPNISMLIVMLNSILIMTGSYQLISFLPFKVMFILLLGGENNLSSQRLQKNT